MPQPEKPALMRWLHRSTFEGVVVFKDVVRTGAQKVLAKDAISAEAYAESNAKAIWSYLLQTQDELEKRGITPAFEVLDHTAMTLKWCSPSGQCRTSRRILRLRHRPEILSMIDSLTDREFEALACVALRLAGASETRLTPPSNEGGVDFFALITSPAHSHLFSGSTHPLRIIGQSKKYSGPVQVGAFKEFLKTIDEVKYGGEPKTERIVPPWFHSVRGPIIGLMIGHTGFQSGAESRARRHGVILADSLDMAEMVAVSRRIPEYMTGAERVAECRSKITELLK